MAKVKYVGVSDSVVVNLNGVDVEFQRNHQVEVADDVAGRDPDPRLAVAMLELHDAISRHDHNEAKKLRDEITTLDYGTGLLAQDIFVAVVPKDSKKEDDK